MTQKRFKAALLTGLMVLSVIALSGYGLAANTGAGPQQVEDGNETATPMAGEGTATPMAGEGTATPMAGEGTATPMAGEGTATPSPGEGTATPTPSEANATERLTFDNQTSDGTSVVVRYANLTEGGYIVIHDSTLFDNEAVESVVGSTVYLGPGEYENQTVEFDEEVTESGTYVAMIHTETSGNLVLDFVESDGTDDGPVVVGGEPVTDEAEVTVENATSTSGGS